MTLPIGREDTFVGVVDLLNRKAYVWDESGQPENYTVQRHTSRHAGRCGNVPRPNGGNRR